MSVFSRFLRVLANSQLFFFAGFVVVLFCFALNGFVPKEIGESRDRQIHYTLPVIFELSFLLAAILCWLFGRILRIGSLSVAPLNDNNQLSPGRIERTSSLVLYLIPILVGCCATFLDVKLGVKSLIVLATFILIEWLWRVLPKNWLHLSVQSVLAIVIFILCFKSQALNSIKDPHHWSYYLGPISGVLGGRTLLWDQPSQYGFLVILIPVLVSKIAGLSALNALAAVVFALSCLTTAILFYLLTTRVMLSPIIASISACALTLFIPGWLPSLAGSTVYPSVSGFRFLPSFLALWSIVVASKNRRARVILAAVLATVCAMAWSFESFMYCVAPLCAYVFLVLFLPRTSISEKKVPILMLTAGVGGLATVVVFYSLWRNLPVEPRAFSEYAMMYTDSFGTLPMNIDYFTVFYIFSLAYAYFIGRKGITIDANRVFSGIIFFCYLWLLYSYFVARSHSNNVLNLVPWTVMAIVLSAPNNLSSRLMNAHRLSVTIICMLFVNYTVLAVTPENLKSLVGRIEAKELWTQPIYYLPPPRVVELAAANRNLTVLHYKDVPMSQAPSGQTFNSTGLAPFSHFLILSPARRCEYLRRINQTAGALLVAVEHASYADFMNTLGICAKVVSSREIPGAAEWRVYEITTP